MTDQEGRLFVFPKSCIPNLPGHFVYMLIDKSMIIYIGQSESLKQRILDHTDKEFDTVVCFYFGADYSTNAVTQESNLIEQIKPIFNMIGNADYHEYFSERVRPGHFKCRACSQVQWRNKKARTCKSCGGILGHIREVERDEAAHQPLQ